MGGIAGFVSLGERAALKRVLLAMIAAQGHRAPAGRGIALIAAGSSGFAGLGRSQRRIDGTATGAPPMTSRTTSACVVFNGEIYNSKALRAELASAGRVFQSPSDTETILHGYDQWGIQGLLRRLRGMFALAIWDARQRRMILARDRLGEKSLYYALTDGRLIFASELRGMLASRLAVYSLSPAGLYAYLALGSVPPPLTIADPARALEPGHYAVFAGGRLELTCYWSVAMAASERLRDGLTEAEAADYLRAIVTESVAIRMVRETPLGVFLSGGINSSALLGALAVEQRAPLRAHILALHHHSRDNSSYARIAAGRAGAELIEHPLDAHDFLDELPKLASAIDQPSIGGLNTYFLAKHARAVGTMVALSGLGGDEVFGDYRSLRYAPRLPRIGALIRAWAPGAHPLARLMGAHMSRSRVANARTFLRDKPSVAGTPSALRGLFDESHIARLIDADLASAGRRQFATFSYLSGCDDNADSASAFSPLEWQAHLCNQLLRDAGAMSTAHGIEVRCPLIDHELVEFVASLPPAWKFGGRPKALLRRALGDTIVSAPVRRSETGFTLPLANWLQGELGGAIRELLDNPSDIVDRAFALGLWADFQRGRLHWSCIWAIVMLHLWLKEFRQAISDVHTDASYPASLPPVGEPPPVPA